jgi:hypothetical protein
MKRLISATLAVTVLASVLTPVSAEAGLFRRLFGRSRAPAPVVYTQPAAETTGRLYSYEPGMIEPAPAHAYRAPSKPTWMLPKSSPHRYDARY